jgi:hypothetical protein
MRRRGTRGGEEGRAPVKGHPGTIAECGTTARYVHGCRCVRCREASALYARTRRTTIEPEPEAFIADRVASLYAPLDANRKVWLDRTVKVLGRCRICGARVSDAGMEKHPGLCSDKTCHRAARRVA